jgi:hypothetical protein
VLELIRQLTARSNASELVLEKPGFKLELRRRA